jgi:hypothetical protein
MLYAWAHTRLGSGSLSLRTEGEQGYFATCKHGVLHYVAFLPYQRDRETTALQPSSCSVASPYTLALQSASIYRQCEQACGCAVHENTEDVSHLLMFAARLSQKCTAGTSVSISGALCRCLQP